MAQQHMAGRETPGVTGWTGWALFAAFLMGISGLYHIIAGFTALFRQGIFFIGEDLLVVMDYSQWGWVHLGLGAAMFLSAFALAGGRLWGRVLAVGLAILSAVVNFVFVQAYPLWSMLIISVDILVIYSIAVHASELRETGDHR